MSGFEIFLFCASIFVAFLYFALGVILFSEGKLRGGAISLTVGNVFLFFATVCLFSFK